MTRFFSHEPTVDEALIVLTIISVLISIGILGITYFVWRLLKRSSTPPPASRYHVAHGKPYLSEKKHSSRPRPPRT